MRRICASTYMLIGLFIATFISYGLLTSTTTSANDVTDTVYINVPASCNLTSTVDSIHSATVASGVYKEGIGTTTFNVFCNDNDGFGIYAIGYSGDTHGNNEMLSQNSSITRNIATGTATSGNTSNWAMKLTPVAGAITPTIDNGYNNYNVVPGVYTRVASFTSVTNNLVTSKFQSTYSVYAAGDQPAGTYIGKVKYTITHPASVDPSAGQANLDTGSNINKKLKSLANGTNVTDANTSDTLITAFVRSDTLPANFTPSNTNTISTTNSLTPVYVWFDSSDGTMYYYSKAKDIYMSSSSNNLFSYMKSLADISGLKYFIADNVTNMGSMFQYTQISDLSPIANWNVGKVTGMLSMFAFTQISDLTSLANWNVGNVTDMTSIFASTQISDLTPLANWNVGKVTSFYGLFSSCTLLTNISGLENWDTSKVSNIGWMFGSTSVSDFTPIVGWDISSITDMRSLFQYNKSLTDLSIIAQWDIGGVTNINQMFFDSGISDLTPIANWDTSSITSMLSVFSNTQISDLAPLTNWDTSNVTTMQGMFKSTRISDLTPIKDWNVENVTNLSQMFYNIPTLVNSSPISGWNVGKVEQTSEQNKGFGQMFGSSTPKTNLPIFTSPPGTWDTYGTYIPNP